MGGDGFYVRFTNIGTGSTHNLFVEWALFMILSNQPEVVLTIGKLVDEVSRLTGSRCTPAMIYNYERQGLIPAPQRTSGSTRLYRLSDVARVVQIKHWQNEGLSLGEIKKRLDTGFQPEAIDIGDLSLNVDRRSQILDAAARIFPKKGYLETTVQDIINEAGISSPTLYNYFDSKEEIFLALIERISFLDVIHNLTSLMDEREDLTVNDIRAILIQTAQSFLTTHTKNRDLVFLFISESRRFPSVGEHYCRNLIQPIEELLGEFLQTQVQRGILPEFNVRISIHGFFGMLLNFWLVEDVMGGKEVMAFDEENRVETIVDLFLHGILH